MRSAIQGRKPSPVKLVPDDVKDTIWDKCRQAAAAFDGNAAFDKTGFSSINATPVQLAQCIDAWVNNDNETDPLADLYLTSWHDFQVELSVFTSCLEGRKEFSRGCALKGRVILAA